MVSRSDLEAIAAAAELRKLGLEFARASNFNKAAELLALAVKHDPDHLSSRVNLGAAYQALGRSADALLQYDAALSLDQSRAEVFNNRSLCLLALGHHAEAIESARSALRLRPAYPEALNNLGAALHSSGDLSRACECFREAIKLRPDYAKALANLGYALRGLGLLSEALQELQAAFECDAAIESLAGALMHLKMRLCEWEHFDRDRKHLADAIGRGERVTEPFVVLGIFDDPRLHREAARTSRANLVRSLDPRPWTRKIAADGRIKLGYFSADYSNHATTHLLHDLIESHNRERFEVCGFALGPHLDDPEGRRIRSTFDRVVDLHGMGDAEAVSLVRSMGIDIAIDLKGYTQDARPALFERRVAPIQVSFLGYPGTMASPKMDYLIADRVVIPATERAFYEEKIVYLPDSYQVNRATVETFDGEISRAGCKLPPEGTVFCCFNNTFKITPNVFSSWMRILAATPTSILWLLRDNDTAMKKLRARAASEGIEPTRLVFAERVPTNEHLARHRLADVFLDTTPYGAHTTASDALRMGVPVITLLGRSFPSRVAASLLDSIGAGDLAVNTQEDYERLAVSLASDRTALEAVRTRIRKGVVEGNLFRPAVFAVNLEQAFRKMAERQTAGHPPVDITING